MSSFSSDALAARLLEAVARECDIIAGNIAALGAQVSGGTADSAALQSFDFLAQHAQAQAMLVAHLARMEPGACTLDGISRMIDAIPLPQVRARLLTALHGEVALPVNDDDTVLWMDG